jgi:hypothetical protein
MSGWLQETDAVIQIRFRTVSKVLVPEVLTTNKVELSCLLISLAPRQWVLSTQNSFHRIAHIPLEVV